MATSITGYLLTLAYPAIFSSAHIGKKGHNLLQCERVSSGGGKMVADMFEIYSWDGYFLGANTPADDLIRLIHAKKPDMVGVSLSVYFNMAPLLSVIEKVKVTFQDWALNVQMYVRNLGHMKRNNVSKSTPIFINKSEI